MIQNSKSLKQRHNNKIKPYFIFGCISILIIVFTLIINRNLTPDQRFFFKILFALGCAGIAAIIPGISNLKYKSIISGSGAIIVFFIILKVNPPNSKFSITIFPKYKYSGELIDLSDSHLKIQLIEGFLEGSHTNEQTIKFNDVPFEYFGEPLKFILQDSKQWVFENGKKNIDKAIDKPSLDLIFLKDSNYLTIAGTFYFHESPLINATIIDLEKPKYITKTDQNGRFIIRYDSTETRSTVTFRIDNGNTTFPLTQINMGNTSYETNF